MNSWEDIKADFGSMNGPESMSLLTGTIGSISNIFADRKANKATARSYARQAELYSQQANVMSMAGKAYSDSAKIAAAIGKANAREERLRASQLQVIEDYGLQKINKERRWKTGSALVGFAGNGVLVSSDPESSVARWEQDEAADAVIEKLDLMQNVENEAHGYLVDAQQRLSEGYQASARLHGQSAQEFASAYSSTLQASYARAAAKAARKKKHRFGSIIGAVVGGVGGLLASGVPEVGMAGANVGASVGNVFDQF